MSAPLKRIFLVLPAVLFLLLALPAPAQTSVSELADTPWPMYQHDPQHTGRSPFLAPGQIPELLWVSQLPNLCNGPGGGMTIDQDGKLIIATDSCLYQFDPVTRQVEWVFPGGWSVSIPLINTDNEIFWGFDQRFARISSSGELVWGTILGSNYCFNTSPVFGPDGNVYFGYDGLWSFTPQGQLRWFTPYGEIVSGVSPAVGLDGSVYAGGESTDLCAYQSDQSIDWCFDIPNLSGRDMVSAVRSDGVIYQPTGEGSLVALNPAGSLRWIFPTGNNGHIDRGMGITPDDSVYFIQDVETIDIVFAVNADGTLKWSKEFPANPITGQNAFFQYPITVDRNGNLLLCSENSRCYGIAPDGTTTWEYQIPLADSIITTGAQPILADDGLFYLIDNQHRLYAFADPALYPQLSTSTRAITHEVEPQSPSITVTVELSSTVAPITFTTVITPTTGWLTITQPVTTTPVQLTLQIDPSTLPVGIHRTHLQVRPDGRAGAWLDIPVTLNVGIKQVFLPALLREQQRSYRILYASHWFLDFQLASMTYTGEDRRVISHDLIYQWEWMAYAPDGKKVALIPNVYPAYPITVMDTTTGQAILEIPDVGTIGYPTWSPDSTQLAFLSKPAGAEYGDVYKINLDGSGLTRLTEAPFEKYGLYWSPSGEKIAITGYTSRIYLVNADGTDLHRVETGDWSSIPVGWSPDGHYLLYASLTDHSQMFLNLKSYDLQTGAFTFLASNYRSKAAWSPDGTRIMYVGSAAESVHDRDIFVVNPDGSGKNNLTHGLDQEDSLPVWAPDSRWLAFASSRDYVHGDMNYDIYIIRPDGTGLTRLTTNVQADSYPFWQP